jgi:16S rRNA (guanine966-N2)-methyltransferase
VKKPARTPGVVRIIAGTLRGSKLPVADAPGLRPTPDRVRETVFNWLQPVIDGARCLDLFAGTGALGIEAASRGAATITLVERDANLVRSLRENLQRLRVDNATVMHDVAERYLAQREHSQRDQATGAQPYDIVFVDPPFTMAVWSPIAAALEANGWLAAHALIYLESPRSVVPEVPANWATWRESFAGDVRHALYRRGLASS